MRRCESLCSPCLDLRSLSKAYWPGITEITGAYMAEAAAVSLDSQKHHESALLCVKGKFQVDYRVTFDPVSDRIRRAHGDLEVATENGAYAISILLIDANTDLTVVERSRKGTGFDYWLGKKSIPGPYFQYKARLEVSGIRCGTDAVIDSRVKMKLNQTKRSDGFLPAFVVVVEFSAPKAKVAER